MTTHQIKNKIHPRGGGTICFGSNIGLDIDDTITKDPRYFSEVSRQVKDHNGKVFIVSSRTNRPDVAKQSEDELRQLNIYFDTLYLLPGYEVAKEACPHIELDWYQKYLWQKVKFCTDHQIRTFFDDDSKVVELFRKYAPEIGIHHVR